MNRPPPGESDEDLLIQGSLVGIKEVFRSIAETLPRFRDSTNGGAHVPDSAVENTAASLGQDCGQLAPEPGEIRLPSGITVGKAVLSSSCVVKLKLPSHVHIGVLLGPGGKFMKKLKKTSGAKTLHIEDEEDGRWLMIDGTVEQVQVAQLVMLDKISKIGSDSSTSLEP